MAADGGPEGPGLVSAFLAALATLPDASGAVGPWPAGVENPSDEEKAAVPIAICLGRSAFPVLAEAHGFVFPLDVHKRLCAWGRRADPRWRGAAPFVLAEAIAPDARAVLRDERVGYFDRGGSLFLPHPDPALDTLIDYPPRPPAAPANADAIFAGQGARVLRCLLARPGVGFRVNSLAREATVSAATASQTLAVLAQRGWLETRGRERFLHNPEALLAAWPRARPARAATARPRRRAEA